MTERTGQTDRQPAPCGTWPSPITSEAIVAGTVGLGALRRDGEALCWLELRPREGGRAVVVRREPDGATRDVTPPPWNARTRVHEYGGAAYAVHEGVVWFSHFPDQRVRRLEAGAEPTPISGEGRRYADGVVDPARGLLYCVEEDHTGDGAEPANRVVALDLAGERPRRVIAEGRDFFAGPRLSPDGGRLAWIAWDHPDMPWDATELWTARLDEAGAAAGAERVAADGPARESIVEPRWSPDGALFFVGDRSGWWNLYHWDDGASTPLCPREAEFADPPWGFGPSSLDFADAGRVVCTWREPGRTRLGVLDLASGALAEVETPFTELSNVRATPTHVFCCAASPTEKTQVVRIGLADGAVEVLRRSSDLELDPATISAPEPLELPSAGGRTTHALFYAPKSATHRVPDGERPPLVVMSHGGPTAGTSTGLRLDIQFWTSRGAAVVDVDYGGSAGYGREYRERLRGAWGVVDVEDCCAAAEALVARGRVDPERLAIRGGSAGGYTTLCALTFHDVFQAGASLFGVCDLEALARDTHKFESRYLDGLIGPYPERADLYRARSPIHFTERLSCPVIVLQGLEDEVVPPNQAEAIVGALRENGIPVAYLAFEGEQHGFRKAENVKRALEAELYFYGRVFGFTPADAIEPVPIDGLDG